MLTTVISILVALSAVHIGAAIFLWRRARAARQQLAVEIHDKALAFDQRCDHLQAQLDTLALQQRVGYLAWLLERAHREGVLPDTAAARLRRYISELHMAAAEAGG